MAKVMMTIRTSGKAPSLQAIQERCGLADDELDAGFGVVQIDAADQLYTFLVEESAVGKCQSSVDWKLEGPFANPRIAPFGPPEP